MAVSNKSFGELFGEAKNGLDHLQAGLAGILPSMPGMPVGKYFDLAIGIDFEQTIAPPCPVFPVPHVGLIFDILGAIMNAIASALPVPPEPPEGEDAPVTVLSVATAIVNALKPSVKVHGQWINNAGTPVMHLPAMFLHLLPMAVPTSSSEMWMGSSTVLADGGPFSTQFHPALSCNLVGFPSLPRINKTPRPVLDLMLPTSLLLAIISSGKPVLVGGPPTIDLFQLMIKLGLKGLLKKVKFKKLDDLGAKFQKKIDEIAETNPKLAKALQPIKCKNFGEPVDAATGRVIHTNADFELPGPLPLVWERTYYSDAEEETSLGFNWHHSYNMGLRDVGNGFTLRLRDGREAAMPYLHTGELFYHRIEHLFFEKDGEGYFVTDENKLVYRFNSPANRQGFSMLSSIINPQGFMIRFHYDTRGGLKEITDSCGRQIRVANDAGGRVLRVYMVAGGKELNFIQYRYDAAGNMTGTEEITGAVKSFEYEGRLLKKLTNQSNHCFYWEYEGRGDDARCIHTWGDGGLLEYWATYQQEPDGSGVTTARNSLGHTTEYYYDSKKLIYKIIDANGGITYQSYNALQDLEIVVNPEGGSTRYQYNPYGKLTRLTNENDESTTYMYDDRQNLVYAGSPANRSFSREYDAQNRVVSGTGVNGNRVDYEYEGTHLVRITDHKQRVMKLAYDAHHNLTGLLYPNGLKEVWEYDALGNTIYYRDLRGNTTYYSYNDAGQLTELKGPDGNAHHFRYDTAGNLTEAKDLIRLVQFEYGPLGVLRMRKQNKRTVRFNYDTELQLRSIVNEGGEMYKFGLDALGDVVSEWGFDGLNHRYQRDGNSRVTKVLRPDEKWTGYTYDGVGNIIKEEHSDGSMAAYKYDADNLLIEAINETSHIVLQRDGTGRVIKELQDGYAVNKVYDAEGNCVQTASSLGADIQMQYDEWGRLSGLSGRRLSGAVKPTSLPAAWETKVIDFFKQLESGQNDDNPSGAQNEPAGPGTWQALFLRDDTGLELHRQLSGNVEIKTERDRLGRITRRSIGAHNVEQSRTRYDWGMGNKLNRLVNELSRINTLFDYDAFDNLISASYEQKGGAAETVYRIPDKIGNLFKTRDKSDRKYSKGGRLQEDEKYCYYYDGEGNLAFKEFKHNENTSAVNKAEAAKAKGIILQRSATGWDYEWAGNGMLQKVVNPGGREIEFYYDPLGRRTAKILLDKNARFFEENSGMVTRWIWDGNVPLHEWQYTGRFPPKKTIDSDGIKEEKEPVENLVTWIFEENSFVPCSKLIDHEQYSIVTDYLGTPTHAYNSAGEKVWERELDIYGAVRKESGEKGLVPQLYQGQYMDEETGLAYNRFRYYDHESGGYISQDPIGLWGGLRIFGYVKNVTSQYDSLGLNSTTLNKNLGGVVGDQMQAHHIIPEQVWKANQDFFDDIGFKGKMDQATNGILLPDKAAMVNPEGPQIVHRGSHPKYNDEIADRVTNIRGAYDAGIIDASAAKKQIWKLQNEFKNKLWEGNAQHKIIDGKKKLH
ncbi:DUF6531 domain-containing protein [Niabella drilacis]|uniref:RHS repeat-associated core domain-containing protein n=1 Tax=Niabella drilacis (strain DSM 25811 / CCM 8410 / CCUG 62505 / LMG 26954 / E90) TaxID=1285928 RepID=A0A1G6KPP9_NIADE|nr:DUF6531 domain-containing protein [Niabella drilacis]SDC32877.1 RHS repeat-associated core domain-containing protein [Niabella drilacis]